MMEEQQPEKRKRGRPRIHPIKVRVPKPPKPPKPAPDPNKPKNKGGRPRIHPVKVFIPRNQRKSRAGRPRIPEVTPDIPDLDGKLPPKPIDYDAIMHWMDLGATAEEIAGSFRISVSTLDTRLKEKFNKNFSELKETVCGPAKISLRRNQFNLTKTNAAMAIWLGKQWLGQKEGEERNFANAQAILHLTKMIEENEELKKKIESLMNCSDPMEGVEIEKPDMPDTDFS